MRIQEALMLRGAKTILDSCVSLKAGEKLLVVTDMYQENIAKILAAAALEREAEVVVSTMEPRLSAGAEPPQIIAEAMKHVDVVLIPVSKSITHTFAVKEATRCGARILVLTDFTENMLISGGIEADFKAMKPICQDFAKKFSDGQSVRLTSPSGTDLTFDITGRKGNALFCVVEPGEFSTLPTIEANCSPVERSANGRVVADASIPYLDIGILNQPVVLDVENGFIVNIEGGREATILKKNLQQYNDPNCYNIAELGIGLNPKCSLCGIMLEDEGVVGTAHIGIGTNITLGGQTKAPIHYDLLLWHPEIEIDGVRITSAEEIFA